MNKKELEKLEKMEIEANEYKKGEIIEVKNVTNEEFYGENSVMSKKNGIQIKVKVKDIDITEWYNIPENPRGLHKSNVYAFKKKYNHYPKVGLKVDITQNEEGFYKIDIN